MRVHEVQNHNHCLRLAGEGGYSKEKQAEWIDAFCAGHNAYVEMSVLEVYQNAADGLLEIGDPDGCLTHVELWLELERRLGEQAFVAERYSLYGQPQIRGKALGGAAIPIVERLTEHGWLLDCASVSLCRSATGADQEGGGG